MAKTVPTKTKATPPAVIGAEMAAMAGQGQATNAEDFAIPFLVILQSLSPQTKKNKPEFIEEAEEGNVINTVTSELFDGDVGITVLPVAFMRVYLEWKPRDAGGGLQGIHQREEGIQLEQTCSRDEKGNYVLPNGNILKNTSQHYVLLVCGDKVEPALIAMTSTQLKHSRKWNTNIGKVKATGPDGKEFSVPSFGCKWLLKTVAESNAQGDWFGWQIEKVGVLNDNEVPLLRAGKEFHEQISAGAVKVSEPAPEAASADTKVI